MSEKIIVKHHLSYGQNYYYPENDAAMSLLKFVSPTKSRKAFTYTQIKIAQKLGLDIEILPMASV